MAPRSHPVRTADATSNQNWSKVNDDLVQQSCLQTLPGDVRAEHDDIGFPSRVLGDAQPPR